MNRQKKYEEKRVKKTVSFNVESKDDLALLEKSKNIKDFSTWVKLKLKELDL